MRHLALAKFHFIKTVFRSFIHKSSALLPKTILSLSTTKLSLPFLEQSCHDSINFFHYRLICLIPLLFGEVWQFNDHIFFLKFNSQIDNYYCLSFVLSGCQTFQGTSPQVPCYLRTFLDSSVHIYLDSSSVSKWPIEAAISCAQNRLSFCFQ